MKRLSPTLQLARYKPFRGKQQTVKAFQFQLFQLFQLIFKEYSILLSLCNILIIN